MQNLQVLSDSFLISAMGVTTIYNFHSILHSEICHDIDMSKLNNTNICLQSAYHGQGHSKQSGWSGFDQITIFQGKNKIPFYKKQVINKSTWTCSTCYIAIQKQKMHMMGW